MFLNIQLIIIIYTLFTSVLGIKKGINMDNKENLIPEDDYEYEKELAEKAREEREKAKAEQESLAQKQKQLQKERDKRIQAEKIELMKLKNGVIEQSDSLKEEHDQIKELHGIEKLKNIWYHFKWLIIFIVFIIAVCAYIIYSTASRVKPDLTVLMLANNGLQYRQEELEEFFEQYTEDINGDGKVNISVIIAPLDNESKDQVYIANQSKVAGIIQSGDAMIMITDSNTDEAIKDIFKTDLDADFPDNKYISEQGLSLNMKLFAEEVKFENMPNDVVMSIRQPQKTINMSLEKMQEKYNTDFKVFKKITEDLTSRAEKENDPGLTTEPLKHDNSSEDESAQTK